jgi:hypothetical protein
MTENQALQILAADRIGYRIYTVFTVFLSLFRVDNLFKMCNLTQFSYFLITPQAMRSPAFPAGSVFRSSALA